MHYIYTCIKPNLKGIHFSYSSPELKNQTNFPQSFTTNLFYSCLHLLVKVTYDAYYQTYFNQHKLSYEVSMVEKI